MDAPLPAEQEVAAALEVVAAPAPLLPEAPVQVPVPAPQAPLQRPKENASPFPSAGQSVNQLAKYKWLIAGIIGAVLVVGAGSFFGLKYLFPGHKTLPLVFISDNQLMMQLNAKKEAAVISDNIIEDKTILNQVDGGQFRFGIDKLVKLSEDGSKMFFMDRIKDTGATLYYRETKKGSSGSADDKGTKLATGLNQSRDEIFAIPANGEYAIYIRNYETDKGGKLYIHNLKEETMLDKDVDTFWFSDANSLVFYTKLDSSGKRDLYVKNVKKPDDRVKIDNEINGVVQFSAKDGKIYYTKHDGSADNALTLYRKELDKDKVKMAGGIHDVVSLVAGDKFFYSVAVSKDIALADLVNDDKASEDANLQAPVQSDFEKIVQVAQTDWWTGQVTYVDQSQMDYDGWNAANDAYQKKLERDNLRQTLKDEKLTDTSYDLYLYSDSKGTKLTGEYVYNVYTDPSSKTIAYQKNDRSSMGKKNLSEIYSSQEVRDAYSSLVKQSPVTFLVANGGKETEFAAGDTTIDQMSVTDDGKTLYAIERPAGSSSSDSNTGSTKATFVSYDISGGKATGKKTIEEDVASFAYIPGQTQLFYYKEVSNGTGEMDSLAADGTKKKISIDVKVYFSMFFPDDNLLLYLTDFNDKDGVGTLKMYKDGKETKLASDVGQYFYQNADDIYYLTNYDIQKGDGELMKYAKDNKSVKIGDNVTAVLHSSSGNLF